jgi:hypothetical protein
VAGEACDSGKPYDARSLEERIVSCGTAKARYPQVLKSVGKAPEQYGAWDEDEDDEP